MNHCCHCCYPEWHWNWTAIEFIETHSTLSLLFCFFLHHFTYQHQGWWNRLKFRLYTYVTHGESTVSFTYMAGRHIQGSRGPYITHVPQVPYPSISGQRGKRKSPKNPKKSIRISGRSRVLQIRPLGLCYDSNICRLLFILLCLLGLCHSK